MHVLGLVVHRDHRLTVEEMPLPVYGPYQALVRMVACGVCNGTDGKILHGQFKNYDSYPAVLGHEGVGETFRVTGRIGDYGSGVGMHGFRIFCEKDVSLITATDMQIIDF